MLSLERRPDADTLLMTSPVADIVKDFLRFREVMERKLAETK